MNNDKKKLVTLKDYIDSGVTEKMVLGFSLYDADLENYEGKPLDLTSNFDKFHDCEVVSIIASPNPISPTRFAELIINISTTNFRVTNNLNEDDFRNMIISNGDYYTKKMNNSISLSFNNNKIVGEIMNYLFDGGVKSETIKLILFVDNPIPHYVNLYTYLFNNLHSLNCTDTKVFSDEVVIGETAELVKILEADKVYRTPEDYYLICVDLNKNKDAFNKALLYLSAYVNKTYKTK